MAGLHVLTRGIWILNWEIRPVGVKGPADPGAAGTQHQGF